MIFAATRPKSEKRSGFSIAPDAPVIPEFRLDGATKSDRISKFSDKRWDLSPGIAAPNVGSSERFMEYEHYPEDLRDLVWAYCWCAMNIDHHQIPVHLEAVAPARIKKDARMLVRYCEFMRVRGVPLNAVCDDDNDAWMAPFKKKDYSVRVRTAAVPKRLYWYRHYLPCQIPDQQPWKDRTPKEVLGKSPQINENTTERIPRSILEPLFRWAMFYIDTAYADIFELVREDISVKSEGFELLSGTNVQWRKPLVSGEDPVGEAHFLVTASYIVTAYLSGMRDGEIQSIRPGWKKVLRDENGKPYRHLVRATAFKKTGTSTGKKRTWIVLPEVHRALERLEDLAKVMSAERPDSRPLRYADHLFRRYKRVRSDLATISVIAKWLNEFLGHVTTLAEEAAQRAQTAEERRRVLDLYAIPLTADGTPWRLIAKQFRRTVAWYIANEPFGTVAGKRQYGHVYEVTFQGYAGTKDAGFRDEIEMARAVGQMQDILEMYQDFLDGASLGGAKGAVLEREFQGIAAELGDLPGKIVNEARLTAMLKNVAKEVYPGLLNDCFFDSATALCLKRPEIKDRSRPVFAQCDVEKCPNSCIGRKHISSVQDSLDDCVAYRKTRGLSKNQKSALDNVIKTYGRVLDKVSHAR